MRVIEHEHVGQKVHGATSGLHALVQVDVFTIVPGMTPEESGGDGPPGLLRLR